MDETGPCNRIKFDSSFRSLLETQHDISALYLNTDLGDTWHMRASLLLSLPSMPPPRCPAVKFPADDGVL